MIFQLDGKSYDVRVTALRRKFTIDERTKPLRTMDGKLHRDILGTYIHYTMTLEAVAGKMQELEDLWQALSAPVQSHLCRFPYGDGWLEQQMYLTQAQQSLTLIQPEGRRWGELQLEFFACQPEVRP